MKRSHGESSDDEQTPGRRQKEMKRSNDEIFKEIEYLMKLIQSNRDADSSSTVSTSSRPDLIQAESQIHYLLQFLRTPAASNDDMPENK